ncbi:TPA: tyrosine-type recombinase/integrase [Serratia marcescens]|nr:tyrosine-type recombinase/integrase [Serratia marcescens]
MSIKSLGTDGWLVDVRPRGRNGKRVRKKFNTKVEAQQFERWVISTQNNKEWVDKPADKRPLSELIDLWWSHHGQSLKDGEKTLTKLIAMDRDMDNPRAHHITPAFFSEYRVQRLQDGTAAKTVNLDQERLSGVFTQLIALGLYHSQHPLTNFPKLKVKNSEMGFLRKDDIKILLDLLDGDNKLAVKLCLATGGRWNEVADLKSEHVVKNRVTFIDTKNGRNRTVPISENLFKEITHSGKRILFPNASYTTVRETIKGTFASLPRGQAIHVLRHTFASHFMMNGGNILALQKILGHSTITQTMVYAHFAPDYLMDAVRFNPLDSAFT